MTGTRANLRAAALLAGLALGLPAAADEPLRFEATLVAGAAFGSRVRTLPTEETRIEDSGLWGVRLGWVASRSFRLEASFTHASSSLGTRDPSGGESYAPAGDVETDAYELNAFYDFGDAATRGTFGLGAGVVTISPALPNLTTSDSAFAVNVAAGVRQAIGRRLALRAEARYRWRDGRTRVGTVLCEGGDEDCRLFTTNWYSSAELTAGLSWRF